MAKIHTYNNKRFNLNMFSKPHFFFILLCLSSVANCAKILGFFTVPSISHSVVFRPILNELARRGHDVTVITPDPEYKPGSAPLNLTEIDVHDISYEKWRVSCVNKVDGASSDLDLLEIFANGMLDVFEAQVNSREVKNLLKRENKFDLVFIDSVAKVSLVLGHVLDAPLIQIGTFYLTYPHYNIHGAAYHLAFHPEITRKRIYNLTLYEKFEALYAESVLRYYCWKLEYKENAINKKIFGQDTPLIEDLKDKPHMVFLNSNPLFEGNRAVPPSVIYLGQLHMKPPKPLPTELQSYLDSSRQGVIYMSFGTNVNPTLLPPERIAIFCRVFAKLPYNIIWKWNDDELPGKPDNVMISKWLPQADLLRHKNVKLFITQAGLQSTDEAIEAGVPLIAFPMLVDQWFTAEKYVFHGIGIKFELGSLTATNLEDAIKKVIGDASYRNNVLRLRTLIHDQPQTPLERAVWWIEYVLRHGGAKHLRSPMANISWSEYLMLDVVIAILSFIILCFVAVIWVVKLIARMFEKPVTVVKKKQKRS